MASTDTASHFGSTDSIPNSLRSVHQQQQQQAITPIPGQDKKIFFDRSSSEDLGLLTLRSSSDPTIALHSLQSRQQHNLGLTDISQNIQQQQTSQQQQQTSHLPPGLVDPQSTLPSFQETYSIKYNQLATFGLKMDEDCYNIASPHHANMNYHQVHGHGHAHGHQHTMHQDHYDYQQNTAQFISPNFYPYEQQQSMVITFSNQIFLARFFQN